LTRGYQLHFDEEIISSYSFDRMIEYFLIALLAFMPLAFGVVHAWSEEIVIAVVGMMTVCFLFKILFFSRQKLTWTLAYVPIVLFIVIAVLQLVPLPARILNVISPNTVTLRTELLGDLPDADTLLKSMPISFYSYGTKHDIRLTLTFFAVFVVVLNVFRRSNQIKRLLMAIALIGGLVAVITIAQNIFGNGKIYWFISSRNSKGYSGPFINHNNYGQFINLSIGAALALLMVSLSEKFMGKKVTPTVAFERLSWRSSKLIWLLPAIMGLGAATVFISLTRGGMIGLITAVAFTTALFASQQSLKGHGWVMVAGGLLAFICVLYVGFDTVYERLASLRAFGQAEGGRLQILKDIVVAWTVFPVLGVGLGTHSVVYPMFEHSTFTAQALYAENEYAQVLEETGLIGLVLLIILGIIVCKACWRSIRHNKRPVHLAVYGLSFGLLAILVQSMADFGQHLPANAVLSAIFCALILGLAQSRNKHDRCERKILIPSMSPAILRIIIFLGVCVLWSWMLFGANNARLAEAHWQKAFDMEKRLSARSWKGTKADFDDLISEATKAVCYEPDNIIYRYRLGVFRWRSICQSINPDVDEIMLTDDVAPTIHDIVAEFRKAVTVCPTYGPTYSMLGQIEKFIIGDDSGAEKIRKGFRLAPCDPIACFVAGWLDVLEGKTQDAIVKFEKAVSLDGRFFDDVVNIYVNYLSRPHLALSAAGDDIGRLSHVTRILQDMQYYDLAEQAIEKTRVLLEAKCSRPDAPASAFAYLGDIYSKHENNEAAIKCYRQALAREFNQVYWRLELANLLAKMERVPEALHEAKICLQLRPQFKTAENLVATLSVNPAVFNKEN
jgi:tetratricopeptide (TPR) repeat protein/O-antigen ligase